MRSGRRAKSRNSARRRTLPWEGAGFTLIEVMAALAILMLFLVPILGSISSGLHTVDQIRNRSVALRLAQDKMTEIEMLPIPESEGTEDGQFGRDQPGFRWEVEAIKTPDLQLLESQIPTVLAMEIHVRVFWQEAGNEKSVELSTLLIGARK